MQDSNIWNITVDTNTYTPSTTYPIGDNWYTEYPLQYNYWTGTYPTTVYMYQIKCPSCNKMNWAQLETTIECKTSKCKAKLRAVTAKPEHIIEVEV